MNSPQVEVVEVPEIEVLPLVKRPNKKIRMRMSALARKARKKTKVVLGVVAEKKAMHAKHSREKLLKELKKTKNRQRRGFQRLHRTGPVLILPAAKLVHHPTFAYIFSKAMEMNPQLRSMTEPKMFADELYNAVHGVDLGEGYPMLFDSAVVKKGVVSFVLITQDDKCVQVLGIPSAFWNVCFAKRQSATA